MARSISTTRSPARPQLTVAQRRRGERILAKQAEANRMRRVSLACGCTVRDAHARANDWLWCVKHEDRGRVLTVTE